LTGPFLRLCFSQDPSEFVEGFVPADSAVVAVLIVLTGAAIPFIRICEEGLVDIKTGETRGLFLE
jgi:hypothetical protein